MSRVLILGGGGAIGRMALSSAAACSAVDEIVVADRIGAAAQRAAAPFEGQATPMTLDVFDDVALRRAMQDVDAVVNCAGPYYRTGIHCLQAAIAEKRDYLDVCDDWETTHEMLRLDGEARAAGISAIVGMGASPGVTNLLARVAASELDDCQKIVTGWNLDTDKETFLEAEQHRTGTHARITHWLHQLSGEVEIWRNGRRERAKPFAAITLEPPGLKPRTVYTLGHPEPLTLPRTVPAVEWAAHVMVLSRAEAALAHGLAERIRAGGMSVDQATALVVKPSRRPLMLKLRVMAAGVRDRISPLPHYPALFAVADGIKNDRPRRVSVWINRLPPRGLTGATGVPVAVALKMALTNRLDRQGVSTPEEAIDPHLFFEEFASRATERGTAPGALIHIETMDDMEPAP